MSRMKTAAAAGLAVLGSTCAFASVAHDEAFQIGQLISCVGAHGSELLPFIVSTRYSREEGQLKETVLGGYYQIRSRMTGDHPDDLLASSPRVRQSF